MTATATIDRLSAAKPVSRRRSAKPATVSASALAQHLDCSRTYIGWVIDTASITNEAVDELKLTKGKAATAVSKASDVMMGVA